MNRGLGVAAALAGFTGVALGAFGAHGLRDSLSSQSMEVYQTAVQYHLIHSLAALVCATVSDRLRSASAAGWMFILGIVIFGGSLYLLAVTGIRWLGAITPLGGVAFLIGWLLLALGFLRFR